ncbi:remodeling and spacing factor 1 [Pyrus ussuriensis x Pyrus communis]|uniref:Remodeling and spacing factor 1 n=1 Tax=Pyrus ussuriensis x Pyrus communis TaxID=2448454 RepID=A0A5N5GG86_9ROSA|nr:remodeling and spacing factor 1 [Pyrus ussuriensis x Pyrus communis]
MAGGRRRRPANDVVEEETRSPKKDEQVGVLDEDEDEDPLKATVARLRGRWELASVLNFLIVFEPVIGKSARLSAEEIEMGLMNPNSLAQLHIAMLKGIPPVSKTLDGLEDAWVTVLCKKLAPWWPWVAEGEIPLLAAKGEEISHYKELDPTKRLLLLKALCELRAKQDDVLAYINVNLKQGTEVSFFRKDKIGGDRNGTTYWYEGNAAVGHRLYKEVIVLEPKAKARGKGNLPSISFQWETLATNLEEFHKVLDEFSSSKVATKVAIAKTIESDVIPALEKLQQKKEKELRKKQRLEKQLNDSRNSYAAGTIRTTRTRRAVSYTFDEYDRAIHDAIKANKKKTSEEKMQENKRRRNGASEENSEDGSDKKDDYMNGDNNDSGKKDETAGSDTASDMLEEFSTDDDDKNWGDRSGMKDEDDSDQSDSGNSEMDKTCAQTDGIAQKPVGVRWSSRLAGDSSHLVMDNRNFTKNRSRQRPICNSALDSVVIPDSDDENSEHKYSERAVHEESPVTVPEEVSES